ncbi:hypothetical protein [Nocardia sienata]|uniref:hypothetical protein n=1 Tax=Nocardia sienata TaxID=248552 RepID=UPI0007A48A67|nr:hypothetical protein [Nocardia sienata]
MPPQYGPWQAIDSLFRRRQRAGAWVFVLKMLQAFAEASGEIDWQASVDSMIMRAHQHAAGARRNRPNSDNGALRWSTKTSGR